jgi:hypothetical protein
MRPMPDAQALATDDRVAFVLGGRAHARGVLVSRRMSTWPRDAVVRLRRARTLWAVFEPGDERAHDALIPAPFGPSRRPLVQVWVTSVDEV